MNSVREVKLKIREGKFEEAASILRSIRNRSKSQVKKRFIEDFLKKLDEAAMFNAVVTDRTRVKSVEIFEKQIDWLKLAF